MRAKFTLVATLLLAVLVAPVDADARERKVIRVFRQANPCPSTGLVAGACPGWVVDHMVPLCAAGDDAPDNLQWQEKSASYRKDRDERALCAWIRRAVESADPERRFFLP